jgi:hypothetical protein
MMMMLCNKRPAPIFLSSFYEVISQYVIVVEKMVLAKKDKASPDELKGHC